MSTSDTMNMPAMKPPPGVVPNVENPPNGNAMALSILSVCLAISTISMALRFYSRLAVLKIMELQDYLLLASFGLYVAIMAVFYRLGQHPGWLIHQWNLRVKDMVEFMHVVVIMSNVFLALQLTIKTAILVEWIRIFLPNGGRRRSLFFWASQFVIWTNIIFCGTTIILYGIACVPHSYLWDPTIKGGYCRIKGGYLPLPTAFFSFLSDIIILFIPQRVIWKLNMSRRRRIGISFVFALGLAACAASAVRLFWAIGRAKSADTTYNISSLLLTAAGEGTCAILVMCVPAMPKAFNGLKDSGLLPSFPSWGSLTLLVRHRSSQEQLKNAGAGADFLPNSAQDNYRGHWQIRPSSERSLVHLEQMPPAKLRDTEHTNTIFHNTDFETSTSYDPDRTVFLEQHSRQHPWMQK